MMPVLSSLLASVTQPALLLLDSSCMLNSRPQILRHQLTITSGASLSTSGLWHYPAIITDSSTTWEVAQFGPGGSFTSTTTAAVINHFGKRQQMAWFTSFATDWSTTSTFIQHSYIHWVTRGLCKSESFISHSQLRRMSNSRAVNPELRSSLQFKCSLLTPCSCWTSSYLPRHSS